MHGRVAAIEVLVKAGAAMSERDLRGGYTPLHLAADAGQCEAIARLVELGAPLETRSTKGWTPLALATLKVRAFHGQFKSTNDGKGGLAGLLWSLAMHLVSDRHSMLESLCTCSAHRSSVLHFRCIHLLRLVVRRASYAGRHSSPAGGLRIRRISVCCEQGPTNVDAIGVMVELGAKVSAVMEHPTLETPLHIAARCGRRDVLQKLLRCGLPVLARTKVPLNSHLD